MHIIMPCSVSAGRTLLLLSSHFVHQQGTLHHLQGLISPSSNRNLMSDLLSVWFCRLFYLIWTFWNDMFSEVHFCKMKLTTRPHFHASPIFIQP